MAGATVEAQGQGCPEPHLQDMGGRGEERTPGLPCNRRAGTQKRTGEVWSHGGTQEEGVGTEWPQRGQPLRFGVPFLGGGPEVADKPPPQPQCCSTDNTSRQHRPLPGLLQTVPIAMGRVLSAVPALHIDEIP